MDKNLQRATETLIKKAINGDHISLEKIILLHKDWIYNVAVRMVMRPEDAEDITQEVLIKIILNLTKYDRKKGQFRTWVYKIAVNQFLSTKKRKLEEVIVSFEDFGHNLDSISFKDLIQDELDNPEVKFLIEESKMICMMGMLLCLDRKHRMVFILSEILGMPDKTGSVILEISKANFRKRLSRARKDLYNFIKDRCGLINKNNLCKCPRKTKGFIERGWVDPENLKFVKKHLKKIKEMCSENNIIFDEFREAGYDKLHRETPYYEFPEEIFQNFMKKMTP